MKRAFPIIIALSVVLCSCQQAQLKRVRVAPEGVFVKVDTIRKQPFISHVSYVGTVEVGREVSLSAQHGGTLSELNVRQGQRVKAGDPIAKIESQGVRSVYETSMATLRQAEDGYERARMVYESGSIPEVKMVEIRTQLAQAKASAEAAQNALEECVVRAPFDGEISEIPVGRGEHVALGQPVAVLVNADDVEISISVPETEAFGLKIGEKATASFPSLDLSIPARVKTKAVVGSRLSHAYKFTLSLDKRPSAVLPGMVCKVSMDKDGAEGIVIPSAAAKLDDQGKYVWMVDDGGTVLKRRIETGGYSGKGIVVKSGLEEGELLIVEGTSKVSTGMKVRVKE